MWDTILSFVSKPLTSFIEGDQARKFMKDEGKLEIQKAKVAFKVAQFESQADRLKTQAQVDGDYDIAAQAEKRHTLADEFLLLCTVVLVACHFIFPESMAAGWLAMGYTEAPWWLEFIIVGLFISVFGLMRLFRAWNPFNKKEPK